MRETNYVKTLQFTTFRRRRETVHVRVQSRSIHQSLYSSGGKLTQGLKSSWKREKICFFPRVALYTANPRWELVKQRRVCAHTSPPTDSLESRDAVSLPHFPPDLRHSSSLLHSHHDDSQLPCKHHDGLKHVRPDDGLQTPLSRTAKTSGNHCDARRYILFLQYLSHWTLNRHTYTLTKCMFNPLKSSIHSQDFLSERKHNVFQFWLRKV